MPTTSYSSPTLVRGAATIGIDELRGLVGFNRVPPDHNGTVGPNHVVSVFNHAMQIFDKAGNLLATQLLDTVFGAAPGGPLPTDPNIMYDAAAGRFVFVSFEVTGFDATINPGNDSVILNVGVSKTSNPLDGWHVTQINARTVINGVSGWSDFPSIAVDGQAIYITANMFGFDGASPFLGNRVWIVAKGAGSGGLYDGGAASVSVHDPVGEAQDLSGRGVVNDTLIAVRIEDVTAADSGIFLVSGDSFAGGANEISQVFRINNPLGATSITVQTIDLGDIAVEGALPGASQLGTANRLGSGDDRVWSGAAVERDGRLYYAFDITPRGGPDAGQTTVHFVELDAANPNAVALVRQTNIGGEDIGAGVHTFMPSLAVNRDGTVIVNYSASGPTIYPGAYYSLRGSDDPSAAFGPAQTLAAGVDHYFRNRAGEGISTQTTNRWGDFSGVSVDPTDGTTFFLFNMFADTRGSPNAAGQDGRWRLAVGSARATILDFDHVAGEPVRDYFGGLGADGITFRASSAGGVYSLAANGAGVDFLVAGVRAASAFSVETVRFAGGAGADILTVGALAAGLRVGASGGYGSDRLTGSGAIEYFDGGDGFGLTSNGGSVFRLYEATLDRGPDVAGFNNWVAALNGGQSLVSITTGFINSVEFQNVYGALNDTEFVTLLYNNVLDRAPDPQGLSNWVALLNGGTSREAVVNGFSESQEFILNSDLGVKAFATTVLFGSTSGEVFRLYEATLDRTPDEGGFINWTAALAGGQSLVSVASGFVNSTEFQTTYGALNNTQFVTLLYNNVLNRAPDTQGLNNWVSLLNGGSSRESVVIGFSESNEFKANTAAPLTAYLKTGLPSFADTLVGGAGDDLLFGGRGPDRFDFAQGAGGADSIYGFEAIDTLRLTGFGYANPAAALSHFTQAGSDVLFSDQGQTITFHDTNLATIQTAAFLFG